MTKTVLIVDDSSFITEGLASILKKNYRTIVSSGGEMCLELLKRETPDIIILDILMEPMDGWETLLHIRENPATCQIPVVMFSAKKISPFEAETHHPHIDDYITKPVSPRNLLETIEKVLSRREASQKNIELWKQAGVQIDEIEEYARLTASIEVDRGLYSNLQQQLGTERRDAPTGEIQRTVEMISTRIRENTLLAEEIARRGNVLVAAGCKHGSPGPASTTELHGEPHEMIEQSLSVTAQSRIDGGGPGILPEDPRTISVTPEGEEPGTGSNPDPVPDTAAPNPPENRQDYTGETRTGTDAGILPSEKPEHPDAEPDSVPDTRSSPVPEPVSPQVNEPGNPGSPIRPHTQETIGSINSPVATIPESLREEDPLPAGTKSAVPVQFPVLTQSDSNRQAASPGNMAGGNNDGSQSVAETPANNPPSRVQPAHDVATGTDRNSLNKAQVAGNTSTIPTREKPTIPHSQNPVRNDSPRRESTSPGFFAQIIAAIRNIFSRSKP